MLTRTCPCCSKEIPYKTKKVFDQATKRNSMCKSCRTVIANKSPNRKNSLSDNPYWKGYKMIPFSWFSKYFLRGAKKRTGDITIEQMYNMYMQQGQVCALSGVPIGFSGSKKSGHTASIDRIDSSKEYTLDNVQLVHKDINLMKNHFNQEYFITICSKIANHAMR